MQKISFKIIISILFISLLVPNNTYSASLSDIESSMYKLEIKKMKENGIIEGFPDGTYRPNDSITRAEFAKVLAVALRLDTSIKEDCPFEDVKGQWHEGYVCAVYKSGLMIGTSTTTFAPDNNINREELSLILIRAFNLLDIAEKANWEEQFIDEENISPWTEKAVKLINNIGLLEGITSENGISFLPKEYGSRELVSKLIYELLYNKNMYDERIEELGLSIKIDNPNSSLGEKDPTRPEEQDNEPGTNPPEDNSPVVELDDIISRYTKELSRLEAEVEADLDSLVSQAQEEYRNGSELYSLYKKYEVFARELEAETDGQVFSILNDMEIELEEYGYDTSAARELYTYYKSTKDNHKIKFKL